MCRNIHTLHNFEPAATNDEVHAAALQYVRKVSGSTKPSKANAEAFDRAVAEIAHITRHLLDDLVTTAPAEEPRGRGGEGEGAQRAAIREHRRLRRRADRARSRRRHAGAHRSRVARRE